MVYNDAWYTFPVGFLNLSLPIPKCHQNLKVVRVALKWSREWAIQQEVIKNYLDPYPCTIYFRSVEEGYSTINARIKCSFGILEFPIWEIQKMLVHVRHVAAIRYQCAGIKLKSNAKWTQYYRLKTQFVFGIFAVCWLAFMVKGFLGLKNWRAYTWHVLWHKVLTGNATSTAGAWQAWPWFHPRNANDNAVMQRVNNTTSVLSIYIILMLKKCTNQFTRKR